MKKLISDQTLLLIIDVQEKLVPAMSGAANLVGRLVTLIKGIHLLNIPIIYTEQYPKGLGATVPEIRDLLEKEVRCEKQSFSCCLNPDFNETLKRRKRHQILIGGIETHVCVFQTCLDLLADGYAVYLVADTVASRKESDSSLALRVLENGGVNLRSVEMVLFELLQTSRHEKFKEVSKLIK